MIRIYSANYTASDYKNIADILWAGVKCACPNYGITVIKKIMCKDCDNLKACNSCMSAIRYCEKKAGEMVEP